MRIRRASLAAASVVVGCQAYDRGAYERALDVAIGNPAQDVVDSEREAFVLRDTGAPLDSAVDAAADAPFDAGTTPIDAAQPTDAVVAADSAVDAARASDVVDAADVVSATNLLLNGSFEAADPAWLPPWTFAVRGTAVATIAHDGASVASGRFAARINVTAVDPTNWYVLLSSNSFALSAGHTYTVTFWARSAVPEVCWFTIQQSVTPYATYFTNHFAMTTSWQYFTVPFVPAVDVPAAHLGYVLGDQTGTVWLDNVALSN